MVLAQLMEQRGGPCRHCGAIHLFRTCPRIRRAVTHYAPGGAVTATEVEYWADGEFAFGDGDFRVEDVWGPAGQTGAQHALDTEAAKSGKAK